MVVKRSRELLHILKIPCKIDWGKKKKKKKTPKIQLCYFSNDKFN